MCTSCKGRYIVSDRRRIELALQLDRLLVLSLSPPIILERNRKQLEDETLERLTTCISWERLTPRVLTDTKSYQSVRQGTQTGERRRDRKGERISECIQTDIHSHTQYIRVRANACPLLWSYVKVAQCYKYSRSIHLGKEATEFHTIFDCLYVTP